jgi:hypothetical protein
VLARAPSSVNNWTEISYSFLLWQTGTNSYIELVTNMRLSSASYYYRTLDTGPRRRVRI